MTFDNYKPWNFDWDGEEGFDPNKPLSKTNRLKGQNYFDDSIREGLIKSQESRNYEDILGHGLSDKGEFSLQQMALPGEANDPMIKAITAQAEREMSPSLRRITAGVKDAAKMEEGAKQRRIADEEFAVYQNEVQNYMQQYEYQVRKYQMITAYTAAKEQAEAQLWGSIFSAYGSAVGMGMGKGK